VTGSRTATIEVRVIPRAKREHVGGERDGRLLVRVTAPPVDGKANAAVIAALAKALGVPRRDVAVAGGATSRDKLVRVDGMDADDQRLAALRC
jgi:uncharacterized protein (TIGR00251 family)